MNIELLNRVIDNGSLMLNGFLFSWAYHLLKSKDYWLDSWFEAKKEVRELEEKLAKFNRVGGSE